MFKKTAFSSDQFRGAQTHFSMGKAVLEENGILAACCSSLEKKKALKITKYERLGTSNERRFMRTPLAGFFNIPQVVLPRSWDYITATLEGVKMVNGVAFSA